VTGQPSGDTAKLPMPLVEPLGNGTFFFKWRTIGIPKAALDALMQPQNHAFRKCCFSFEFVSDQQSYVFQASDAFVTVLQPDILMIGIEFFPFDLVPMRVSLKITYQGQTYMADTIRVERSDPVPNSFAPLYATFMSDRCTTCHSMGDHDTIRNQHVTNGVILPLPDNEVRPQNTVGCDECHKPPHVTAWKTPAFSQGINWQQMTSAKQICSAVVSHLGSATALYNHFHDDPRVRWAISDGVTPFGDHLPTAPPGDLSAWFQMVDTWISSGFPCPAQ
jgi:hypothetical protein